MPLNNLKITLVRMCETGERLPGLLGGRWGAFQHLAVCLVSRCKKKAAASKRVTVHRAPRVLTLCLERADQRTGTKISKVCVQVECNFLFIKQRIPQSSVTRCSCRDFCVPFWGEENSHEKTSLDSALTEMPWLRTVSCPPSLYMLKAI